MIFDYKDPIANPEYGTRIFRRRIRIEKHGQTILAGLEDTLHALQHIFHLLVPKVCPLPL